MKSRLQKLIAKAGLCSRRKAEELISEDRVRVNGELAKLGDSADPETDTITVDGKEISPKRKVYYLLNKPPGYECTQDSTSGKPLATDLVRTGLRVFTVGRLDAGSRGLIIVTNDGDFANLIGHPRSSIEKEYHATVAGQLQDDVVMLLRKGVPLDDVMTRPCEVSVIYRSRTRTTLGFTLHEGRKRQIRRMLEVVGFKVSDLVRVRIGSITIGGLDEGKCRALSPNEIRNLTALAER